MSSVSRLEPAGKHERSRNTDRLDRSRHLIVLACPEAPGSQGMEMEAHHWFSRARDGQVLIIVTEGNCDDWEEIRGQLLPPSVAENLVRAPVWASLEARRGSVLSNPKNPRLRGEIVEDLKQVLLAFFPGHDWGHLRGEERRQRRRLIALLSGVALLFLVIAMAAVGFARDAQRRQHEARSRELAAYAVESLSEDPERSVALGIQAVEATWQFHQAPPPVAEDTLHRALLASHEQLVVRGLTDVAFSPDGKRLATGSADYTAKLWDAGSGRELLTLRGHTGLVNSVSFSPDGKRLATGSADNTTKLWDADSGEELLTLRGHALPVVSVAFSPDGGRLATAGSDGTANVWDVFSGRELLTLPGHTGHGFRTDSFSPTVAFSPDGRRVAITNSDYTARVWDAFSGQQLLTLQGHIGGSLGFSPDGQFLAIASDENTARVWDANRGQELLRLGGRTGDINTARFSVRGVAFSPDGKRIATASDDGTATVWDMQGGGELLKLSGHSDPVTGVAFSPDGEHVATAGSDARLWDTAAIGQELLTFLASKTYVRSVAFSSDGKRIATAAWDHTAKILDAVNGRELLSLVSEADYFFTELTFRVDAVAFSPDGKRLATGGSIDGSAQIWDGYSGRELLVLRGHTQAVQRGVTWKTQNSGTNVALLSVACAKPQ